jgi:hypothetical protein
MQWIDLLDLVQSVFDGVMFGATYALIGIGFTLILASCTRSTSPTRPPRWVPPT